MKGFFITVEGIDGSGKTTQIGLLEDFLKENNIPYIRTREPGGTILGKGLREILLNYDGDIEPICEQLLYQADRAQHFGTVIVPALEEGKVVLCDRCYDSTVAYQGYARGLDIERINQLNKIATKEIEPNLTLIFDVAPEIAIKRLGEKKDRLESEGIDFYNKVRYGFLEIAKQNPKRIKIIDSSKSAEEVFKVTLGEVKKLLINEHIESM